MTDLRVTVLSAEAWVKSPATTQLWITQVSGEAWITSPATQVQQFNPHFPDKPGLGHGGGGPPGGGGGSPSGGKNFKIGSNQLDDDPANDSDDGYPAFLVTSTGGTFFPSGATLIHLSGQSTAAAWLNAGSSLRVSGAGQSTAQSYSKGAAGGAFAASGRSRSSAESQAAASFVGELAGSSFSAAAGAGSMGLTLQLGGALLAAFFAQASFGRSAALTGRLTAMAAGAAGASLSTLVSGASTAISSSKGAIGFLAALEGMSTAMAAAQGVLDRTGALAGRSFSAAAGQARAALEVAIGGMSTSMLKALAGLRLYPVLDATGRYVAHLLIESLLKDDQPGSYITRFGEGTDYITKWPRLTYIAGISDVYISKWIVDPLYIATTRVTNMPQAEKLPPIDALVQTAQTITFDFGDGSYLPAGVTLTGTPVCTLEVEWGDDDDPASRILVPGQIGTAPKPYGSGRTDTAVLAQVGDFIPTAPVGYVFKCYCTRTDGDVASMDVRFDTRIPGGA